MSLQNAKVIAIDVDGTITNGNYYMNEDGDIYKNFNTRDMHAIYQASKSGYKIVIVSGSYDKVIDAKVGNRYHIISESKDKAKDLEEYLTENELTWEDVIYIGDGENDYQCILKAAYSACPANAIPELLNECVYVAEAKGGEGAVSEIIRHIYKLLNMKWPLE